jgi:hypothetical protein
MYRVLISFIFSLLILPMHAQLDKTRQSFFQANEYSGLQTFIQDATSLSDNNALYLAYKGAASAMSAGIADGVGDKLSRFNTGKKHLEQAVTMDASNAEIRFIRLSVQLETPFFLCYRSAIDSDLQEVIKAIEQKKIPVNSTYWQKAIKYLIQHKLVKDDYRIALTQYQVS